MRNWPLRWKIAHYSAVLAVAATFGGAVTTWFVMRHAEIAAFDRRLTTNAHEFFRDVEHFEGGRTNSESVFKEILVPLSLRKHLVEVLIKRRGVLSFPAIAQPFPRDGIKEFHNHKIDGKSVRAAEFSQNGLTLRAGDDLTGNQPNRLGYIPGDARGHSHGAINNLVRFGLGLKQSDCSSRRNPPGGQKDHRAAARPTVACSTDQGRNRRINRGLNATFERLQRSFEQSVVFLQMLRII